MRELQAHLDDINEDVIQNITDVFISKHKEPIELLKQCIERSKDKFNREYAKLNSYFVNQKFYTEEGVKERQVSLKYKMLLKERHPEAATDKDRKTLSTHDKALCMLVLHNSKINKIQ